MNQVAEKLDQPKIEISAVLPKDIYLIWKYIDKFLEKSCRRSNGRHTIDTIYKQLIDNQVQLWVVYNTEEDLIKGCIVTNEVYYPTGLKMLNILQLGGKNMQDWVERGIEVMTKFAKENGCEGIEGVGRHGQWNWVKNKPGWKKPASMYEYIFEESK